MTLFATCVSLSILFSETVVLIKDAKRAAFGVRFLVIARLKCVIRFSARVADKSFSEMNGRRVNFFSLHVGKTFIAIVANRAYGPSARRRFSSVFSIIFIGLFIRFKAVPDG